MTGEIPDWFQRALDFKAPARGELWWSGEGPEPKRPWTCRLGFHASICHNYHGFTSFDTCNVCMRRV